MKKQIKILSVDPSGIIKNQKGHIGVVYYLGEKENDKLISKKIINFTLILETEQDYQKINYLFSDYDFDILIVEDFLNYKKSIPFQTFKTNEVSEIIGIFKYLAKKHNKKVIIQKASDIKTRLKKEILFNHYYLFYKQKTKTYLNKKNWNYSKDNLINTRHELDAFRHLLFYLLKNNLIGKK